jgi:prophage antirepressor-like protein
MKKELTIANYVCDINIEDLHITLPCYGSIETPLFYWKDVKDLSKEIKSNDSSNFIKGVELDENECFQVILGTEKNSVSSHGGIRKGSEMLVFSEDGLYEVLMAKTKLKHFRKPIKSILKTLRQDGMYISGEDNVNSVEELDELLNSAYERKILRKYGIGVRKDLTKVIDESLHPKNKFLYATITDQLIYMPTVGKTASQMKKEYKTEKLRDEHFTNEELMKIANQEQFVSNLIEKFKNYHKVKEVISM